MKAEVFPTIDWEADDFLGSIQRMIKSFHAKDLCKSIHKF